MKRTAVSLLLLLSGILICHGADLRFRSGRIVAAELSRSLPYVTNADRYSLPSEKRKGTAAAVVLELVTGRMISIHDYLLEVQGTEYPADALRIGDGSFSGQNTAVSTKAGERVTLLYFIPSGIPSSGDVTLKLIPTAEPRTQSCSVRFTNLGVQSLTLPSKIGKDGALK